MNCTAEKQLSHGVFESFEIRKDSFFTVPQCEDTAPIQIGEILNNTYLITRFIAQGGMGIVYEGIDLVLHRKVAIKVLVTDFDDEEYEKELKLFQTEINLCGNLRHPNVIQIYYSGIHHRLPYLVMEYIEGIPINEYVMKQRRFNWNQKVKLISQVASGLAYIHKNNILHRDIKPSNILVKADGTPVLIDFGISIKKNLATVATSEGELSGTIHYMSPEQVAGEYDKINERSDIYSLGLILYELLIKRPAYTGSPNEIIGQIFNSSLLPPSDVNINISETLSNITMKAIAKEPEDRYSTATEFIEDLRLYLKNGNNKPIINKVPLWQKAFCYLKPNTATAISLIWIAFFFIIVAISHGYSSELISYVPRKIMDSISNMLYSIELHPRDDEQVPRPESPKGNPMNVVQNNPKPDNKNPKPLNGDNTGQNNYVTETTQENANKTTHQNLIAQNGQTNETNETAQQNLSDDNQPESNNSKGLTHYNVMQDNPSDTPEQKEPEKKPNRNVPLRWIDIKAQIDNPVEPINWEKFNIEFPPNDPVYYIDPEFNSYIILPNESYSNISLSSDKLYKVTANKNELTFTNIDAFTNIDVGNSYKKIWCLNESIIIAYPTDGFDHLDKIDLNNENNITSYDFSSNKEFGNINFDNGQFVSQFVKIKNDYYFLSYSTNPARLYLLHLEEPEPESDTRNGTIDVISSQDLDYFPIANTSIVVLNDTLYYFGCNLGWAGLCAVKLSDSNVKSQTPINGITVTDSCSLFVTDNVNRIWIINNKDTDGVIEYNTRKKVSQKISNEIDSYPVFYSRDSAVSFYSNGYLYCIVGQQAYMLDVGVSTKEKIIDSGFTPKDATSSEPYDGLECNRNKFIWVDDSIQIKLDKQNDYNNVFSGVTISNKNTQKNWKKNVLHVQNDLDVIGIILKNDFRDYYRDYLSNIDSCSVLISEKYYSLEDEDVEKYGPLEIQYKEQKISVPCLPFWCIVKLNKKVRNEDVQNVSEWKWRKDYKSFRPDYKSFSQQEIAQFNYLDKKGCGITKGFRLMYIIPNE